MLWFCYILYNKSRIKSISTWCSPINIQNGDHKTGFWVISKLSNKTKVGTEKSLESDENENTELTSRLKAVLRWKFTAVNNFIK